MGRMTRSFLPSRYADLGSNRQLEMTESPMHELRVLERNDDGSAVVELPIAVVAETLDLSMTAGSEKETIEISGDDLLSMQSNVSRFRRPMPVNIGEHLEFGEAGGPASAFIDALEVRGEALFARISLNSFMAFLVLDEKAFRGFSVDVAKDLSMPTGDIPGFTILGGLFTNRPALEVNFKVAASIALSVGHKHVTFGQAQSPGQTKKESTMDLTERVAQLEASLATKDEKIATLETSAKTGEQNLEKDAVIAGLRTELVEKDSALASANKTSADVRILELMRTAVKSNRLTPAFFNGCEADPSAWATGKGLDVKGLESLIEGLEIQTTQAPVGSGSSAAAANAAADGPDKLNVEIKKIMLETKVNYDEAMQHVKLAQPEMYRSAMRQWENKHRARSGRDPIA